MGLASPELSANSRQKKKKKKDRMSQTLWSLRTQSTINAGQLSKPSQPVTQTCLGLDDIICCLLLSSPASLQVLEKGTVSSTCIMFA